MGRETIRRRRAGQGLAVRLFCSFFFSGFLGLSAHGQAPAMASDLPGVPQWITDLRNARDVTGKGSWLKRFARAVIGLDDREKALLLPAGVHVDGQGRILVADTRARVVHLFDQRRRRYQTLRAPDSDPFMAPIAVASDSVGRIYVSDSGRSRIFVFSDKGKFLRTLGGVDKHESIFERATGLAIDARRERLYVVDTMAMRVVVLSLDGHMLARIGHRGSGPGEFNFPTYIAVAADGTFWVTDSLNFRAQHFDSEGNFLAAFGRSGDGPGNFNKAKGIALDDRGRIYVVEGLQDRVHVYDPNGTLLFTFGRTGNGPGEFFLPTGITTDSENRLLVSDSYNGRVEIFHLPSGSTRLVGGN